MNKAEFTRIPLSEMRFALPCDRWRVLLCPDEDHDDLKAHPIEYTPAGLLRAVGYLRRENMNGRHIYGRPMTNRHILVDDLDQDALDRLEADGLRPAVIVRTSKANYQAWITVSDEEIDDELATAIARLLADRYDGDPGAAHCRQVGRLPGFTNRKEVYRTRNLFPFTGLHGRVRRKVAPGAEGLIADAKQLIASGHFPSPSPPSTRGGCARATDIDPFRSTMTAEEAQEIYACELQVQAKVNGWPLPLQKGLRSDADFRIARSLYKTYGFDPDDIAALLKFESVKANSRNLSYVIATVQAVTNN